MARPSNETIARVPLFAGLEKRDLERIADSFKERNYSAGETIAGEGQGGAGFFIIGEGTRKSPSTARTGPRSAPVTTSARSR